MNRPAIIALAFVAAASTLLSAPLVRPGEDASAYFQSLAVAADQVITPARAMMGTWQGAVAPAAASPMPDRPEMTAGTGRHPAIVHP